MTSSRFEIITSSPAETVAVGSALADWLRDGDVILLHGDLGAGKTTLTKGVALALRIDAVVSSPSFSLINEYETGLAAPCTTLYHLDLYRLQGEDDLASIGFDDFAAPIDGVTFIEWPERAISVLPDRYLLIEFEHSGSNSRRLQFLPLPDDGSWAERFKVLCSRLELAINGGTNAR